MAVFHDAGALLRVVVPRSTRGHAHVFAGRPERGLEDAEAAVDLARSLADADGEAMALWHTSEALTATGEADLARAVADEALALARHLGHRGWTATALLGRGLALEGSGDLDAAAESYRRALDESLHLPLFACWARARLARVLVRQGEVGGAGPLVDAALTSGPALGRYEARLARCELLVATGDAGAAEAVDEAVRLAESGGHVASAALLRRLVR